MNRTKRGTIACGLTALAVSACTPTAPECADDQAVDTVLKIVRQKIAEQSGKEALNQLGLKLTAIRTTEFDEKLGRYTCAADLEVTGPGGSKTIPVRYTSELADGGKNFYISVYGL